MGGVSVNLKDNSVYQDARLFTVGNIFLILAREMSKVNGVEPNTSYSSVDGW
jgi:hypothetical protein